MAAPTSEPSASRATNHDAFISYNHKADFEMARVLERGLQRLARPWNRVRAMSVFRDESDLSALPHMWPSIQEHLDESRFLVILACPESAASVWVNREITHFCETKGSESVIVVLTGGELEWNESEKGFTAASTAAPPALKGRLTDQPLWLDMRWARGADELLLRVSQSQFRSAVARVAARVRNMSPEDLESEDVRQHRRTLRLARLAVATVVALGIVAVIAAVVAVGNAHRADRRAREATGGQLGLDALDIPTSDMARALLLSVAAGQLAPQSDKATFRASRVLIGRYSKLTGLLDAGAARQELSVLALALTNDGSSVVGFAAREGPRELLRWDIRSRAEPTALMLPTGISPRLTPIGTADAVVVGEVNGTMLLAADGQLTALDGVVQALDAADDRAVTLVNGSRALIDVLSGEVVAEIGDGSLDLKQGWLAVASDTSVHLLNSTTGAEVASSATLEPGVSFIAVDVDADGRAVVAVTSTGQVMTWERSGNDLVAGSTIDAPPEVGSVHDLVGSADGQRALLVGSSGSAVVDLDSGGVVGLGPDETGVVVADPAARYAAVGGKQLVMWDLRSGDRLFAVPEVANALAWSGPCDDGGKCRLVTAGETLDLWNPATGRRIRLSDQTNAEAVAVSTDATVVASAGWGHAVALWSAVPIPDDSGRATLANEGEATSVDPVTLHIARATSARSIEITGEGNPVEVATGPFERFVLAPNGRRLLTTTADGLVHLFDASTGAGITVKEKPCAGDLMAVSGGGDMVAVFQSKSLIAAVCDTTSGSLIANRRLPATAQPPSAIAVDDDGNVAIGDRTGRVTVLLRVSNAKGFQDGAPAIDTRLGMEPAEVQSLSIHHGVVAAGIRRPAARGAQGSVLVWPIGGTPVQFDSESSDVPAVALIGNSETVVVASRDADAPAVTLQTWETATRRRLGQAFSGLVGDVVVLGGDGTSVVGVDASGAAYRWQPAKTATDEICTIVGRPLTRDEWDNELGGVLQKYAFLPVCASG
jgi:WD40 repeat protein